MGRSQIWSGTEWVEMTGGATGGGEAVNHSDLAGVTSGQHHARYTNSEAVAAMGSLGNSNALNHTRYSNTEARAAVDNGTYLKIAGGTMTGALRLNAGVNNGIVINSYSPAPEAGKDQYWFQTRNIRFKDTAGPPPNSEGQDGDVCLRYSF